MGSVKYIKTCQLCLCQRSRCDPERQQRGWEQGHCGDAPSTARRGSSEGADAEMLNSKPWIYASFTPSISRLLPSSSTEQLHNRKHLHATLICSACSYLQQLQIKSKQLPSCRGYIRCFIMLGDFTWCISPSHRALNTSVPTFVPP